MKKNIETEITPKEFEEQVKTWIQKTGGDLKSFTVDHLKTLEGDSGEYEIDVTAVFTIFQGAEIKVLIECKRYKKNIERDVVMVLESKLRDSSAHKGMIFSTSGFQRGALEFAQKRGIATITVNEGHTNYHTKSAGQENIKPPPWINIPDYIGWFITINEEGNEAHSLIDDERIENIEKWLKA